MHLIVWRMNAINPSRSKPATLAEAAQQFAPVVKASELLDKHKDAILLLRARGASYPAITQILQSYGVSIGDGTVARFCRQHETEIKRLRAKDMHTEQALPILSLLSSTTSEHSGINPLPENQNQLQEGHQPASPSATPNKMRSLRGKV
jgi:hypothetical protein